MNNEKMKVTPLESHAMNKGNGPLSYAQNSSYQGGAFDAAQEFVKLEIAKKLDIDRFSSGSFLKFFIADFGCSTAKNTYVAMQTVVDAAKLKFQSQGLNSDMPEFLVFFNDLASNDFNTLFSLLPAERNFYAAGLPGSFYGLLFPKESLHFGYSSCALNWLSGVPNEVVDKNSPACNCGRMHYICSGKEVLEAYSSQFAKDMDSFLFAREQELVSGGLMALIMPGLPDGISISETITSLEFGLLEACLIDMTKKGLVSVEKMDSFNLPVYFPTLNELQAAVKRNRHFTIERLEVLNNPMSDVSIAHLKKSIKHMRAALEGIMKEHFGNDIIENLFDEYSKRLAKPSLLSNLNLQSLNVLLVIFQKH